MQALLKGGSRGTFRTEPIRLVKRSGPKIWQKKKGGGGDLNLTEIIIETPVLRLDWLASVFLGVFQRGLPLSPKPLANPNR